MEPKILESKKIGKAEQNKRRVQIILLSGLVLLFIYVIYSTFFAGKKKPPPAKTPAADVVAPVEKMPASVPGTPQGAPVDLFGTSEKEGESGEEDEWGISPFSIDPVEEEEVVETEVGLDLQGIVYSPDGGSYAIINEKILKKGDRIADNTVREITTGKVILEDDEGEEQVLIG